MICKHCKAENEDGALFCSNCGKPLEDEEYDREKMRGNTKLYIGISIALMIFLASGLVFGFFYFSNKVQKANDEQKKKQEAETRENGHTIAKKMEILNNEQLTDHEKILELSKLCYDTKRTIYVKTQEGAFKFERSGDSVLISHANPMKRTLESQATYTFRAIGGVVFNKLGGIKDKEVDIRDAVEQIRMDNGFDKHTRELEKNVILESDIITDVEKSAHQKDLADKEQVDKNILEGNQEEVREAVLSTIAVNDKENDREEENKEAPKTIVVGAGTEYEKEYEVQLINPEGQKPYLAVDIDGTVIEV